jgi:Protein of unknown function (DUF4058)
MPSPLPGMDPYLEHPSAWANIHHRLITAIADDLAPQLLPKYQILVEERVYQETVRQKHLEVREIAIGQVVTVIEVLSPVNKRSGQGRIDYENKRARVFSSSSNMVEIDLLRQGKPMSEQEGEPRSHYRILVSAQEKRPQADLYAFNLQDTIPVFPLPLRSDDRWRSLPERESPLINLKSMLDGIYDRSGYGFVIDYSQAPTPALSEGDLDWIR